MLASNSDIIAVLGTAQQELSIRRWYQLQHALPKDMASLCSNENIPITDKLFSDDANKTIKTARETFTIKNYHSGGQQPHPYKRGQNRHFLGHSPSQYSQQGSYSSLRGQAKPWNQRIPKVPGEKSLTARNQNAELKEVRDFCNSAHSILEELQKQSEDFSAGQIHFCLAQWKQITIGEEILKIVEGADIDFAELPVQEKMVHNHTFSTEQIHATDLEVSELLKKAVIKKAHHSNKEYISPIFLCDLRKITDGEWSWTSKSWTKT